MHLRFSFEIQTTLWLINIIAINIIMGQAQIFYDIYENKRETVSVYIAFILWLPNKGSLYLDEIIYL